jgi:hypothetical protein
MAALRSRTAAAALGLVLALTATAHADVTGKVSLTGTAGKPPLRGRAFLDRTENPYTGGKMLDPMPYLVVVLTGDSVPAPPAPPQVKWKLLGESFERPLLPVPSGAEVVIQNEGKRAPTLFVEGSPDVLPRTPLNPRGERAFKAGAAGTLHVLKDEDTAHLTGAVLALPSTYFAVPSKDGKYTIDGDNLPDGEYTLRVWYRTGWLEGADTKINVKDGKASKDLTLPPGLKLAAAP